ncbi:MAG: tetratricopeptide repeat protein [Deltaproteobacteria bacterium]|nr:tetratricopeptide repeat protein [Deltaproteobacteria bacterium]
MKNLLALSIMFLLCCPAWAETEAPKLTPAVRKTVYDAQQAMEKKEFLKAEKCLKKYVRKYPQKPHYLVEFTLGNALALMGKEREALSHYKASVDLYPDYAPIWQNMGKICFDLKQYEKAGDCLLKAYETGKKKDPSALYNVAVSYIMAGKEKKALPHLLYLSSGRAGLPKIEWLEAMLKVYMDLQLKEKAFELINRLIDKSGNDPRWWKMLAQFHLQQNDYKKALAALTIHSYLTPINKKNIMLLGDLASAVGVPLKAGEYYEKALNLSNSPANYEKLASAYIAAHKPAKAIQVLNMALKKKPASGLWFMMGQVLYQEENFDKAYNAFDQSARLDPGNGRAYLMMGYCALQTDRKDTARSAFQKASRFSKQRKMAKELLKQVVKED